MAKRGPIGHDGVFEALNSLAGYAVTCRIENTPEWMEGLVEKINAACCALHDTDRFQFDARHMNIRRLTPGPENADA